MSAVTVGLVQQRCTEDREHNISRSIEGIREAHSRGARLVALQELHAGVYFPQQETDARFDDAEPIPGPLTERFGAVARELGVVLVLSLFERRAAGLYHNSAAVLESDGTVAGIYRKMHIPDDPQFYEKFYFAPGDTGFVPIATSLGKLGVLVCWDQWYPEAARLMALAGADLLIYPTAIGNSSAEEPDEIARQVDSWITVQRSHAITNGLPVAVINRTGFEPNPAAEGDGLEFWGRSFIAGCQGEMMAQATADQDEVVVTEIDLGRIDQVRRAWPFLRDRRIEAYGGLLKRFGDSP